ncbi:MAG: HAMP domain-containing protein [Clostridiaceae bacterium]|nr:HAMP domain-containing protein [Clostridiaceae bacterium]
MKLDIENKILIPFMIVLILSIATLGIVSYWNGYKLLLNNEIQNRSNHLEEIMLHMEDIHLQVLQEKLSIEEAKLEVIRFYSELRREGFFIITEDEVMLNHFNTEEEWTDEFLPMTRTRNDETIQFEKNIFIYRIYREWNWIIGYGVHKSMFSQEVLETQKYMVLLSIVSLMFSMQAAIFIAHNISKPIKLLADLCDKIGMGSLQEKITIKRNDEIGMLAKAFNNMTHKLQMNTAQLMKMTELNEDILRNISTGIITTDQKGNETSINPAAQDMLCSVQKDEVKSWTIRQTLQHQIQQTLDSKESIHHIHVFEDDIENRKLYVDVMTSLLKGETGKVRGAICSFRDITEGKHIENNMETLDRLTSMGQFAAGMAHEIRNPLAGMKTSVQVLQKRLLHEDQSSNSKLFKGVLYEIDRINQLITDLLNFAKPKKPRYEVLNIKGILERTLALMDKGELKKNIKIDVVDYPEELLSFVDRGQIEQVFLNIIKNAVNAVSHEGTLKIILDKCQENSKNWAVIKFQDDGCGISSEDIGKIFDPFYTTSSQGTGLGLSVVYELVKENKGSIQVNSRVGKGTEFRLTFPLYGIT